MMRTVIWLTGGHASGKTTVLKALIAEHGTLPGVVLMSADNPSKNDAPFKVSAQASEDYLVERLSRDDWRFMLVEGTRLTPQMFQALARSDPDKARFDFQIWLVRADVDLIVDRIKVRRARAGRVVVENSPIVASGRGPYEFTGRRQVAAVAKYGHLYPHKLVEFETKEGFPEQPAIIESISGLIRSAVGDSRLDTGCFVGRPKAINLRGTSGSGKSYAVVKLIKALNGRPLRSAKDGKILGYELDDGVFVLGSYENECGGCDAIRTQDEVCRLVEKYTKRYRLVVFEGVIVGLIFQRYIDLSRRVGGIVWAYIDTPYEMCLDRILMRRHARGDLSVLSDFGSNSGHTKAKFDSLLRQRPKVIEAGENVVVLDHRRAPEQLLSLVQKGAL